MGSWVLLLCLTLLHHSMAIALSQHYYNIGECDALLRFRNSFTISKDASSFCDFPSLFSNTLYPIGYKVLEKTASWKNGTDCCSWDGVTCHAAANYVIGLDLSCSRLQGPFHSNSSLFSLPNLRWLNLAGNDFNGSQIPSRLGIFRGMEHLNLSNSGFSGLIPLGMMSNLSNLITLDLSSSYEIAIEDQSFGWLLRNLTQLGELVLDRVDMSGVSPISLTNLSSTLTSLRVPNLQSLYLYNNYDLTGTLSQANWTGPLNSLDLSYTKFNGLIPALLGNLTSLKTLNLSHSGFTGGVPNDIFHLPNLQSLSLSSNYDLTGTLPQANWTGPLKSLDISLTKFHGSIPASLGNLTSLNYLDLSDNGFTGGVPPTLRNLDQLTLLDLGYNNLTGSVDFEMFARLKSLKRLYLNDVNVLLQSNGNCSFPRLQILWLSSCNLTTTFPYFLGSSNELEQLSISGNAIGGPIPEWLGKIYTLTELDLASNNITGEIPSSICQLSSLEGLDLSNNRLNGTIPGCLGNLSHLSGLFLGDNLLQGPLPQSLANCTRLEFIDLHSNKFHGVIEVPLPSSYSLNIVDLSNNNFSGQLPANFLINSTVYLIDLRNNSFDGPLPIPPRTVQYYFVSKNKFTGEVPHQICSSMQLEVIDLSNNRLNGSIPNFFNNFTTSLSVLDLRANNFVGHIPDIFVPENHLRTVRLSQNQLQGTLPRSLELCQNLEVLDLGENELEGSFPDWLGTLPKLQVLVLRSNRFHGPVGSSRRNDRPFAELRIFDISNNKFHGPLPAKYIARLKAMRIEERNGLHYMNGGDNYYQDSIVVVMKGIKMELEKILTVFTTIDFSSNFFEGKIPKVIGDLKALKGLNLSHNNLSGNIPSSLGNLTNLEWLDLSSNKLGGEIPWGLADLASLEYLNLSNNHLAGPIPRGTQFDTFDHAFDGNPGLCGHPLPNECGADARQTQPTSSHEEEEEEETESGNWIEWRAIAMGYECGLVFGISAGYVMLETGRPRWLARMMERKLLKKRSRTRKNVAWGNHARRNVSDR